MTNFYKLNKSAAIQLIFETLSIFEEYCKSYSDKIDFSYFTKKYESLKTTSLSVTESNLQTLVLNCSFKCAPDLFRNFLHHMNIYKNGKIFVCKNKHVIQVEMFILCYTLYKLECTDLDIVVKEFLGIYQNFQTTLAKCKHAFVSRKSVRNVKKFRKKCKKK